jgi:hypothetical protein
MARDYYAEGRALAAALARLGHESYADQIHSAVAAGSTGGEALMALRWTLGRLLSVEPPLPQTTQDRARELHNAISEAL